MTEQSKETEAIGRFFTEAQQTKISRGSAYGNDNKSAYRMAMEILGWSSPEMRWAGAVWPIIQKAARLVKIMSEPNFILKHRKELHDTAIDLANYDAMFDVAVSEEWQNLQKYVDQRNNQLESDNSES